MRAEEKWLVTGATGFIGARLCEYLSLEKKVPVRALVHRANTPGMARLSRLPVEVVQGDLLRGDELDRLVEGCPIVAHLGLGVGRGISVGTRNILLAAEKAHVRRFLHVSSVAVHGLNPPPEAEVEDVRLRAVGNVYGDEKIRSERIAMRFLSRGVPMTILRPGIVFGPFGQWTKIAMARVRADAPVLIDGGSGICNTLYVDNLVHAIALAVATPDAIGKTFFVTDGERITWKDYYGAYGDMLHQSAQFQDVSSAEIRDYWKRQPGIFRASVRQVRSLLLTGKSLKQIARIPIAQWLIDRVAFRLFSDFSKERVRAFLKIPQLPVAVAERQRAMPDLATTAVETTSVQHSIERIRKTLGYEPLVDFHEGIRRTEAWLKSAGYLA